MPVLRPRLPPLRSLPLPSRRLSSTAAFDHPPLASAAYSSAPTPSTSETPEDLTPCERQILERIVRVDQAGELGANWIYKGQAAVIDKGHEGELIRHMWDQEKHHLATFDEIVTQHGVRPTALYPIWQAAGWIMGAGTAVLGKEAAMACTEAVETVIGEHYDDQLKQLETVASKHASLDVLRGVIEEFRDDELEHLDTAVEHGAQQAPAHALLSAIIGAACKVGVFAAERV